MDDVFFWLPMIYVFLFSLGLGLILSVINVFFRDVKHLYGVFVTMWMYLSAIFYPVESLSPELQNFMRFNPMYHYIKMFRGMFLDGTLPSLKENLLCLGMGLAMIGIGLIVFRKNQDKFILHI